MNQKLCILEMSEDNEGQVMVLCDQWLSSSVHKKWEKKYDEKYYFYGVYVKPKCLQRSVRDGLEF